MNASLAGLYRTLRSPLAVRPYASIAEQMIMSGTNLAVSLVVVRSGGVAALGVYSFLFVLCSLMNGVFSVLLHRQMMLASAAQDDAGAEATFLATLVLELALAALVTLALAGLALGLTLGTGLAEELSRWGVAAGSAVVYLIAYNLFDLFRQFMYTRDAQVTSLGCTLVYAVCQMTALGATLAFVDGDAAVATVYAGAAASHAIAVLANRSCRAALSRPARPDAARVRTLLSSYFEHARFGLVGMLVTWLQNQSMNPFLMLAGGATVAGHFSLARLLVMPVAVVSQGLVNSSTPRLRRAFERDGAAAVDAQAGSMRRANLFVWLGWTLLLLGADASGLAARFVPDYAEVRWFVGLWVAMLLASLYRFWTGQLFVVSMRFRFLLRTGLAAATVSVGGMLVFGLGLDAIRAALWFGVAGELIIIALFARERRRAARAC